MISVLALFMGLAFWSWRCVRPRLELPVLCVAISVCFLLLLSLERGDSPFFVSDEAYYVDLVLGGESWPYDRYLWYLINYILITCDLYLGGVPLKLINIPISVFSLLLLWKAFDHDYRIFYLVLFLPYYAFLSVFNFRDHLILFCTLSAITGLFIKGPKGLSILGLATVALFFLRPVIAAIVSAMLIGYLFIVFSSRMCRGRIHYRTGYIIVLAGLAVGGAWPALLDKFGAYSQWLIYAAVSGTSEQLEVASGGVVTGNRGVDFGVSLIRYVFAPFPWSILSRLLEGGSATWGWFDDLVRVFNQFGYYWLLAYLALHVRLLVQALRTADARKWLILLALVVNWPIYSFHLYGSTHQRLKIQFQVAMFLMCLLVSERKRAVALRRRHV